MSCPIDQDGRFELLATLEEMASDGVSFCSGAPGTDALKDSSDIILKATTEMLGSKPNIDALFKYGPERGSEAFLTELSNFLTQQYGAEVLSSNLMVTASATQGLHLVLSLLCDSTGPILVEDPTYFLALKIFQKDFNMNVVPVPSSEAGIDLDILEEKLASLQPSSGSRLNNGRFWATIYLVTVFGNPTGIVYSPVQCQRLVQLARKHNVLVVVDDVYNLIWYPTTSLPPVDQLGHTAPSRLLAFDKQDDPDFGDGHVVSLGSFSKILAPSIRLGWIEAPDALLSQLYNSGLALSGGSFNHYMSEVATSALKSGMVERHVEDLRLEYGRRMEKLCETLEKHMPEGFTFTRPQGGFFLWLRLPKNVDMFEFVTFSVERYGVIFLPGVFFSPSDGCRNCARLSISNVSMETIESGIKELCMAYKDYCLMR